MGLQEPRSQEGAPGEVDVGFTPGWLDGVAQAVPIGNAARVRAEERSRLSRLRARRRTAFRRFACAAVVTALLLSAMPRRTIVTEVDVPVPVPHAIASGQAYGTMRTVTRRFGAPFALVRLEASAIESAGMQYTVRVHPSSLFANLLAAGLVVCCVRMVLGRSPLPDDE